MFKEIIVRFRCTRTGLTETSYAADLSQRLACRLALSVPGLHMSADESVLTRLSVCLGRQAPAPLMAAAESRLVGFHDELSATDGSRLLVGDPGGLSRNGHSRLYCFDESALDPVSAADRPLEMLIPFGDSYRSLEPALDAVLLAKALEAQVCFYHTTWREPGLDDAPPERHMCDAAKDVLAMARHRCQEAGVRPDQLIECADDIAQGVVRAALRRGSRLIVLAHGRRTYRGSYVDQVIQRSTVPVLVMARQEGVT